MEAHLVQRTPEWLSLRKKYVCASDSIIIMGMAPTSWKKNSLYHLWQDKQPNSPFDGEDNFYMKRGRELEPEALRLFEATMGFLMSQKVLFSEKHPWMMASLDGFDIDGKAAIEIKCPWGKDHDIALEGKVPEKYYPQIQHQIEVTGLDKIYFMSYNPDHEKTFAIMEVDRDDTFISEMIEKERKFYEEHMLTGIPPENPKKMKNMDVKIDEILTPERVIDTDVWRNLTEQYKKLDRQEKEASRRKDEILDFLVQIAESENAKGNGITLTKVERKGIINYQNIPELKTMDLEKYRKPGTTYWQVKESNYE